MDCLLAHQARSGSLASAVADSKHEQSILCMGGISVVPLNAATQ